MSVQRYRRKPAPRTDWDQLAARYEPGKPLDDLLTVARTADDEAEVCEVTFPSGKRVLLAWYTRYPDDGPAHPSFVTVEPGKYLAGRAEGGSLYDASEGNWRQFYDIVSDEEG